MGRAFEYRKAAKFARWDRMAKQFSRIGKEIAMAVKDGGPDPDNNPALKRAIQNAKGVNMPKDNVERAIKKASGADAEVYDIITFEGYAPHGIGIFVECTTNNNYRTVANIRAIFNKVVGKTGEIAFMFERKGVFSIEQNEINMDWDEFELEMIDAGVDDIEKEKDLVIIYSDFENFGSVSHKLDEMKINVQNALQYSNLSKKESYLLALAVAANEKNATLQEAFSRLAEQENATKAELAEIYSCVSLLNVNNACQTCHQQSENELIDRVHTIQDRTYEMRNRAIDATLQLTRAIAAAVQADSTAAGIQQARDYQRRAQFYADFVEAENSMGFHADQEAMRILAMSIDYARLGQMALRGEPLPEGPTELIPPVQTVTPASME